MIDINGSCMRYGLLIVGEIETAFKYCSNWPDVEYLPNLHGTVQDSQAYIVQHAMIGHWGVGLCKLVNWLWLWCTKEECERLRYLICGFPGPLRIDMSISQFHFAASSMCLMPVDDRKKSQQSLIAGPDNEWFHMQESSLYAWVKSVPRSHDILKLQAWEDLSKNLHL